MTGDIPSSENKKRLKEIRFSVLDLCPITEGSTAADALKKSLDLAQHAERWGYTRYWVAEHHNMPGIASSATSVVIGFIAGGTSTIRVGSGGVMLPNHAPLVVAEQFGTLESLYPGRIDLGLGRAPGTDQRTAYALRRDLGNHGQDFPELLQELRDYFTPNESPVHAVPGEGLKVPIWLLGSSGFSARLAGQLGLPFGFASHFSPEYTLPALDIYRSHFQPSEVLAKPYAMVGVNAIVAETDEKANWLATSQQQQILSLMRGRPSQLKPPVETMEGIWSESEQIALEQRSKYAMIGCAETVEQKLQAFLDATQADEMIVTSPIYDHKERLKSYEYLTKICL